MSYLRRNIDTKTRQLTDKAGIEKQKEEFNADLLDTAYKTQGGLKRTAVASFADRNRLITYNENLHEQIGEKWVYRKMLGQDKKPSTLPYYDAETDSMVFPDSEGDVRILNKEYILKKREMDAYIEKQVDQMVKDSVISDSLAKDVLDLNDLSYVALLGSVDADTDEKGDLAAQKKLGMGNEMRKIDARVSTIRSIPAGSLSQTQALSKLRFLCKARRHYYNVADFNRNLGEAKGKAQDGFMHKDEADKKFDEMNGARAAVPAT